MKFILDNKDIDAAMLKHVESMGIKTDGCNIDIKVTRSGSGHIATVDVTECGVEVCGSQLVLPLETTVEETPNVENVPLEDVEPVADAAELSDDTTLFT